jgi:hypothetical protein
MRWTWFAAALGLLLVVHRSGPGHRLRRAVDARYLRSSVALTQVGDGCIDTQARRQRRRPHTRGGEPGLDAAEEVNLVFAAVPTAL